MKAAVPQSIELRSGSPVPTVGLGLWKAPPGVVSTVVTEALKSGYRHLDSACDYGNETEVGAGIKEALDAGVCAREDIFVTSKLWNTFHRAEHVKPALMKTLQDLGLDYLDSYLIHFPISLKYVDPATRYPPEWKHNPDVPEEDTLVLDPVPVSETWAAMEALVDEGLVRHIGVCNFNSSLLTDLLSYCRIRPAMLQIELHPWLQQTRLLELCQREHIKVTAFSPLGSSSYRELSMDKQLGTGVLGDEAVVAIASAHGKSPAQVVLRWGIQRMPGLLCVIPKTSRVERLAENMDLFGFELTSDEMVSLGKLDRGLRFNDPGEFCAGMGFSIPIYD